MIRGYSFERSEEAGGSVVHNLENGPFLGQFAIKDDAIMVNMVRNRGTAAMQACTYALCLSEPARWAQLAQESANQARLIPPETFVMRGQPRIITVPASGSIPALVVFTDDRWRDEQGQYLGLKVDAYTVEHLGRPVDLNTLIPVG